MKTVQLRIEHTKSRSKDPLKEFAPEPAAPRQAEAPRSKTPVRPAPAVPPRLEPAVPGTPDRTHARLLTLVSAAALIQAPLVAMWLMGVPSPLVTRPSSADAVGSTHAVNRPADATAGRTDQPEGVAFLTPVVATGTLWVTTQPAGSAVSLDGVYRGRAPMVINDVPVGAHTVTAQLGGQPVERPVVVSQDTVVPVLFAPTTAATSDARGRLLVESPIPLQVYEDGALVGSSSGRALTLPVGEHLLEFGDDSLGFRVQRTVRVTAGITNHVAVDVPSASLAIDAKPWAEVWVDGTPVGTTPLLSLTWPIGRRQVRVRHPELGERLVSVLVTRNAAARVDVDLRPN